MYGKIVLVVQGRVKKYGKSGLTVQARVKKGGACNAREVSRYKLVRKKVELVPQERSHGTSEGEKGLNMYGKIVLVVQGRVKKN